VKGAIMNDIPIKNYIILGIVILFTIMFSFYLRNWYNMSEKTRTYKNLLAQKLPELKLEEVDTFLMENPNIIIYISSGSDQNNKNFEKNLYEYIVKRDRVFDFVYLDKDSITEQEIINFQKDYGDDAIKNRDMTYIPNFYVVQEGKIVNFYNTEGNISYEEAIRFLKEAGV